MVRNIVIIASILLLIGGVGSLLTFKLNQADAKEEVMNVQANFDSVAIHSDDAHVEVLAANVPHAEVIVTTAQPNFKMSAKVKDSTLEVHASNRRKGFFNINFWNQTSSLKVIVPETELNSLDISNENGRIHVGGVVANEIVVGTDNGRIVMQDIPCDHCASIVARTDNGGIEMRKVWTKDIQVWSSNGSIQLDDVSGVLKGQTDNGSITLNTSTLDRDIDFITDNGKILIHTEKEPTNAILDFKTSNGRIKFFGKKDWDTIIGAGKHTVKLMSENGGITVE